MTDLADPLVLFTGVFTCATIAYAVVTFLLWRENRKLVKAQNEATSQQKEALAFNQDKFKAERRPEVFVTFEPQTKETVTPNVINFGHTPAVDITIIYHGINTPGNRIELGGYTLTYLMPNEKRALSEKSISLDYLRQFEKLEVIIKISDMYGIVWNQGIQIIDVGWLLNFLKGTVLVRS